MKGGREHNRTNPNSSSPTADAAGRASEMRKSKRRGSILAEIVALAKLRPTNRRRAAKLRSTLVKATVLQLQSSKLERISIARIANIAGCSVGAVYGHFANKQALIDAALQRALSEELTSVKANLDSSVTKSISEEKHFDRLSKVAAQPFQGLNRELLRTALLIALRAPHDANVFSDFRSQFFSSIESAAIATHGRRKAVKVIGALKKHYDAAALALALQTRVAP